ncbi:AmpG family muropeptide MFS transporter [Hahella sp. NBU794]|uniref:AmpG family muropeptide MFS transporter n=1 Tax=Hahella sp. NBU794 TaxID=3422590 RepID=UPI003D6E6442
METPSSWRDGVRYYLDKRLLTIFVFGISSGFPAVMIGSAVTAWLKDVGYSRTDIGFFGLVFLAYSTNFLWSPVADRVRLPCLTRALGQRRSWVLMMQALVAVCCWAMSGVDLADDLLLAKSIALALAFFAATQDIAIDAYRIDVVPEGDGKMMSAASAMATAGWWTGYAGLGAAPFILVGRWDWGWADMYVLMAAVVVLLMAFTWLAASEPTNNREGGQQAAESRYARVLGSKGEAKPLAMFVALMVMIALAVWSIIGKPGLAEEWRASTPLTLFIAMADLAALAWMIRTLWRWESQAVEDTPESSTIRWDQRALIWLLTTFIEPLAEFFRRNGVQLAASILLFIFLFKIGEAFLGKMSVVFYKEVGFTDEEIGIYSKAVTWWVTIVFSILGSLVNIRYGLYRGLMIGGIAMAASNLMFAALAMVGPSVPMLVSAVVVDGFTSAWSTVAFVAFLSVMCNRAFTAAQYALMASLGTLGRTLLASYSGALVDSLNGDWVMFFIITTLMITPSLIFLTFLRVRLEAVLK